MRTALRRTVICALLAAGFAHAGTVKVNFVEPGRYRDIGIDHASQRDNLDALAQEFTQLGGMLPERAVLRVDVLDVDLSGKPVPGMSSTSLHDVRVGSTVDWPRIHLRYALEVDGAVVRTGEEWIKEMNARSSRPMHAERRMLRGWMRDTFGQLSAAR